MNYKMRYFDTHTLFGVCTSALLLNSIPLLFYKGSSAEVVLYESILQSIWIGLYLKLWYNKDYCSFKIYSNDRCPNSIQMSEMKKVVISFDDRLIDYNFLDLIDVDCHPMLRKHYLYIGRFGKIHNSYIFWKHTSVANYNADCCDCSCGFAFYLFLRYILCVICVFISVNVQIIYLDVCLAVLFSIIAIEALFISRFARWTSITLVCYEICMYILLRNISFDTRNDDPFIENNSDDMIYQQTARQQAAWQWLGILFLIFIESLWLSTKQSKQIALFILLSEIASTLDVMTDIAVIFVWMITDNVYWAAFQIVIIATSQFIELYLLIINDSSSNDDSNNPNNMKAASKYRNPENIIDVLDLVFVFLGLGKLWFGMKKLANIRSSLKTSKFGRIRSEHDVNFQLIKIWEVLFESFPTLLLSSYIILLKTDRDLIRPQIILSMIVSVCNLSFTLTGAMSSLVKDIDNEDTLRASIVLPTRSLDKRVYTPKRQISNPIIGEKSAMASTVSHGYGYHLEVGGPLSPSRSIPNSPSASRSVSPSAISGISAVSSPSASTSASASLMHVRNVLNSLDGDVDAGKVYVAMGSPSESNNINRNNYNRNLIDERYDNYNDINVINNGASIAIGDTSTRYNNSGIKKNMPTGKNIRVRVHKIKVKRSKGILWPKFTEQDHYLARVEMGGSDMHFGEYNNGCMDKCCRRVGIRPGKIGRYIHYFMVWMFSVTDSFVRVIPMLMLISFIHSNYLRTGNNNDDDMYTHNFDNWREFELFIVFSVFYVSVCLFEVFVLIKGVIIKRTENYGLEIDLIYSFYSVISNGLYLLVLIDLPDLRYTIQNAMYFVPYQLIRICFSLLLLVIVAVIQVDAQSDYFAWVYLICAILFGMHFVTFYYFVRTVCLSKQR